MDVLGDEMRPGEQLAGLAIDRHHHEDHAVVRQVLTIAQERMPGATVAEAVDQDRAGWHAPPLLRRLSREFQHAADLRQQYALRRNPHLRTEVSIEHHVPVLAMNRHGIPWA